MLDSPDTSPRVKQRIRKLVEIESLGAEVICLRCDVCRRDEVERSIEAAYAKFGTIDGVIHAAGVIEDCPIQVKSRESASRVLAPKVVGNALVPGGSSENIERTVANRSAGFRRTFSSVSSVPAPAGQVDYAAANAFLDAFAAEPAYPAWSQSTGGRGGHRHGGPASPRNPLLGRRLVDTADEIVYSVP